MSPTLDERVILTHLFFHDTIALNEDTLDRKKNHKKLLAKLCRWITPYLSYVFSVDNSSEWINLARHYTTCESEEQNRLNKWMFQPNTEASVIWG